MTWSSDDVAVVTALVVEALEALHVRYRIGGSVASSALGKPRSTLDVDVACELALGHVDRFVERLAPAFYVDADVIRDAIRRQSSFNVIHLDSMLKVDLFIRRSRPFEDVAFERHIRRPLGIEPGGREYDITTPEDIILHKLEWYRMGGGVSERQWLDAVGVIAVQRDALDLPYLRRWAEELGVGDLLERALDEA
jgi:hypothetical protein